MSDTNKRSEKLASAVYLVTSFFNDLEPLKWKLRSLSTGLIENQKDSNIVSQISSLLQVAKNSGLLSDMNFSVLDREFSKYVEVISSEMALPSQIIPISDPEPVLEKPVFEPIKIERTIPTTTNYLPEIKRQSEVREASTREYGAVLVKKNSRQSVILSLIKRKGEIMIKDVTPMIPGVSEKTVQRELITLVKSGVLKKEGEKRWSKYSLADEAVLG